MSPKTISESYDVIRHLRAINFLLIYRQKYLITISTFLTVDNEFFCRDYYK